MTSFSEFHIIKFIVQNTIFTYCIILYPSSYACGET